MLAPRAGFDKLSPSGKGLLVEYDHAAGAVGLLHLLEALVDCGQRNALGDHGVEVEQTAQVEIDEARQVDREAVHAHDRALQLLAAEQVQRAEADLAVEWHHAEDRRGPSA